MGLYSFVKGARRVPSRIGDTVSTNLRRGTGAIGGAYGGARGVRGVRKDLKSFAARELADTSALKECIRTIHRTSKHLARFNDKRLEKLFERIETDPERFNHVIEERVHSFREDLREFAEAYNTFLESVNDMLEAEASEHTVQNRTLQSLLKAYVRQAEKQGVVVPETLLREVKKEFERFLRRGIKETRSDVRDNKRTRAGLLDPRASGAAHKIKKLVSKYRHDEMEDITQNLQEMQYQLQHGVKPDFLLRFLAHLKNLQRIEEYFKKLHHDVNVIMLSVESEVEEAYEAMARFLSIFRNVDAVKESNLSTLLSNVQKEHDLMKEILHSDETNLSRLKAQLQQLKRVLDNSFTSLHAAAERVMNEVTKDPRGYVKQRLAA